ncbi:MAG: hypothetical protein LKJ83_04225 [Eubacteriaceae bacterium]|jgi:hypothetical protein|nr:hypothetical protein [Eubacteriaceae bacterium]
MNNKSCVFSRVILIINIIMAALLIANMYYFGVFKDENPTVDLPAWIEFMSWGLMIITTCLLPVTAVKRNEHFSKPLAIIFAVLLVFIGIYSVSWIGITAPNM